MTLSKSFLEEKLDGNHDVPVDEEEPVIRDELAYRDESNIELCEVVLGCKRRAVGVLLEEPVCACFFTEPGVPAAVFCTLDLELVRGRLLEGVGVISALAAS